MAGIEGQEPNGQNFQQLLVFKPLLVMTGVLSRHPEFLDVEWVLSTLFDASLSTLEPLTP